MRSSRKQLVSEGKAAYLHVMNRVVGREFILGDDEKEYFVKVMRSMSRAMGVEIMSYCIMSNHFHILLHVPDKRAISDKELKGCLKSFYNQQQYKEKLAFWRVLRENGGEKAVTEDKERLKERMFNVSIFMQELQQRFTRWFNKQNRRKGTLWEDRFKSVLLEGDYGTLSKVSAYIDLNPIRASMVDDPKDYRFCSYGAALGGCKDSQAGIEKMYAVEFGKEDGWKVISKAYRRLLYGTGEERGLKADGSAIRKGLSKKEIQKVIKAGGKLSQAQLLRCRVRYISDGMVLGSKSFVDGYLSEHRDQWTKRKQGGHKIKGGDWGHFYSFRNLKVDVIGLS